MSKRGVTKITLGHFFKIQLSYQSVLARYQALNNDTLAFSDIFKNAKTSIFQNTVTISHLSLTY